MRSHVYSGFLSTQHERLLDKRTLWPLTDPYLLKSHFLSRSIQDNRSGLKGRLYPLTKTHISVWSPVETKSETPYYGPIILNVLLTCATIVLQSWLFISDPIYLVVPVVFHYPLYSKNTVSTLFSKNFPNLISPWDTWRVLSFHLPLPFP